MPWYLDEIARPDEVDWHFAPGQDLPMGISSARVVPDPVLWPLKIIQGSKRETIPDFTVGPFTGLIVVSKAFRELVEAWDPVQHDFIPLEITRPDGSVATGTNFMFKFGSFVDNGIVVEHSDVNPRIRNGAISRYLRTSQRPRLMWRREAVTGRHVWADRYFSEAFVVSDEFYAELKARRMGSFTALESRFEDA